LSHSTRPFLVMGFFQIVSHGTIYLGWLWTAVLLISASWVAFSILTWIFSILMWGLWT
jgi:hypothetical protein